MNIIGIICEYNPFHNGHIYHLNKIKELFPNSLIILVLNGYFMERGDVSIISKEDKVNIALSNNIDIVLELPFVFGTQSADIFAEYSLKMLNELKCEYLVFGSESNNIDILNKMVLYTINNKDIYNKDVKKYLDDGYNYPTSMAKALNIDFEFKANDLLGISYIKAIKNNKYNIKPITIKRTNEYLDKLDDNKIISATNIRCRLYNNEDISKYIPNLSNKYINNISLNDYYPYIKYKIITDNNLNKYLDVDEGIENKLKKVINDTNNIDDLINKVKSKRYTYNKIRRMLVHILVGLTKDDNKNIKLDYIKVLGFNSLGKRYLNTIKKNIKYPLVPNKESLLYEYEIKASILYDLIANTNSLQYEKSKKATFYK